MFPLYERDIPLPSSGDPGTLWNPVKDKGVLRKRLQRCPCSDNQGYCDSAQHDLPFRGMEGWSITSRQLIGDKSMKRALVPLADGFEEIEGITIIDVLRRADIDVVTASLHDGPVEASRKTRHLADTTLDAVVDDYFDMIVLPGGTTGVLNLQDDTRLQDLLQRHHSQQRLIGAICAAPNLLRNNQILNEQDRFTAFPGSLKLAKGGQYSDDRVVRSGTVTTSTSAGSAFEFALDLVEQLCGKHVRARVHDALYLPF